ncbi:hypothetical protein HK104_008593 [Borealophlyctis nickersoniae]|nr:hypothetical protein HK104_008593 [Borealophlyctis nickersoniae]
MFNRDGKGKRSREGEAEGFANVKARKKGGRDTDTTADHFYRYALLLTMVYLNRWKDRLSSLRSSYFCDG